MRGVLCISPRQGGPVMQGCPGAHLYPCMRRLNPARIAAACVALRVVIMPCADVCRCWNTSLHASFVRMPSSVESLPAAIDICTTGRAWQCAALGLVLAQRGVNYRDARGQAVLRWLCGGSGCWVRVG